MLVGTPCLAPEGLGSLRKGVVYYFLANPQRSSNVTFVSFVEKKSNWEAQFHRVPNEIFENGLLDGSLARQPMQVNPPWLEHYSGQTLAHISTSAGQMKADYEARAIARYSHIAQFVEEIGDFLLLDDPAKAVRKRLRDDGNKQNPVRVILWLCSYLCFGRRLEALLPAFRNAGRWSRIERASTMKKPGRPSLNGKQHGHSAVQLATEIVASYRCYAQHGKPMTEIWRKALTNHFGCKTRKDSDGRREFYHPQGQPFPSYRSYRYHVLKAFGLSQVRGAKLGSNAIRNRESVSEGPFTEFMANLYERTETDAYTCRDIPRHALSGKPAPSLVVTRMVCSTTSMLLGIGFSSGSETSDAYRSMYFSAAVPKSYFGRIFGVTISDEQWPAVGLPMDVVGDRGPHSGDEKMFGPAAISPVIREITPSYSGQSKAIIESSHPRDSHIDAAPSYLQSDLTTFQMARREIFQLLKDNETSDVSHKLTPEMVVHGVIGTPIGMFSYLQARGRTNALPISIQEAVRAYLQPVVFTLDRNGLRMRNQGFKCAALKDHPSLLRSALIESIEIRGFAYPLNIRMAWVEIDGQIEEAHAALRINDNEDQIEITLSELIELDDARKSATRSMPEHKAASASSIEEEYKRQTGLDWDNERRMAGRPASRHDRKDPGPAGGAKAA